MCVYLLVPHATFLTVEISLVRKPLPSTYSSNTGWWLGRETKLKQGVNVYTAKLCRMRCQVSAHAWCASARAVVFAQVEYVLINVCM